MTHDELVLYNLNYLDSVVKNVLTNDCLRRACRRIITDDKFRKAPGGQSHHHKYLGGLAVHTAEVVQIALNMSRAELQDVDTDVLITSGIFHDFGKTVEYDPEHADYRRLIRHIAGSHAEFVRQIQFYSSDDIPAAVKENIEHCILSHHGRPEWGSVIVPQTAEAHILHYADMLSANFGKHSHTSFA